MFWGTVFIISQFHTLCCFRKMKKKSSGINASVLTGTELAPTRKFIVQRTIWIPIKKDRLHTSFESVPWADSIEPKQQTRSHPYRPLLTARSIHNLISRPIPYPIITHFSYNREARKCFKIILYISCKLIIKLVNSPENYWFSRSPGNSTPFGHLRKLYIRVFHL